MKLLILILALPIALFAQDNGRLADGRAYRTDNQGVQLVDYIAELELQVEEQKRTITSLVNQLEELNNNKSNTKLKEHDLLAEPKTGELSTDILEKRIKDFESRNFELRATVLAKENQVIRLEEKIKTYEKEDNKNILLKEENSRNKKVAIKNIGSSTTKRSSAFNQLKSNLNKSLLDYKKELKKRDSLYKNYNNSRAKKSLAISLSKLKTKDGENYDSLSRKLKSATTFSSLSKIQKGVLEIRRSLRSDISLLDRLSK